MKAVYLIKSENPEDNIQLVGERILSRIVVKCKVRGSVAYCFTDFLSILLCFAYDGPIKTTNVDVAVFRVIPAGGCGSFGAL